MERRIDGGFMRGRRKEGIDGGFAGDMGKEDKGEGVMPAGMGLRGRHEQRGDAPGTDGGFVREVAAGWAS